MKTDAQHATEMRALANVILARLEAEVIFSADNLKAIARQAEALARQAKRLAKERKP